MMHEAVDYNALSWVRQEIDVTLRQARAVLVEYSGDQERAGLLHDCAELLHQVRGPLQIADLAGADLLVAEMETVVAGLHGNETIQQKSSLEVLLQSMQILPAYLVRLQSSADDSPELLLPQVNLLHSLAHPLDGKAGEPVTTRDGALPEGVFSGREAGSADEVAARAHSARVQFQSALLNWYRGNPGSKGTVALADILGQLQEDAGSESEARLWWVGAGVADALGTGLLEDSREVKQLFGRLDRQIKRLVEGDDVDFADDQARSLVIDLLNCISGVEAGEGRLAAILSTCCAGESDAHREVSTESRMPLQIIAEMDPGTIADYDDSVVSMTDADPVSREDNSNAAADPEAGERFQDMLRGISLCKEAIEDYLNLPGKDASLQSVPAILDEVYNGLGNAGLVREAGVIASVQAYINREMLEPAQVPDDEQLRGLADAICGVEFYLECLRDGRIFGNRIIELAESHVAALGYPVSREGLPAPVESASVNEAAPDSAAQDDAGMSSHVSTAISSMQIIDLDADEEILGIFLDESHTGLQSLRQLVPGPDAGNVPRELLEEISRAFHTLKGNGRMLGANALGEFAYVCESLVNSALNGGVPADSGFTCLLEQACDATAQLLEQVKDAGYKPEMDIDALSSGMLRMIHAVETGMSVSSGALDSSEERPCDEAQDVSVGIPDELPVLAADVDPEIVDIYIEEAGEEVARLAEIIPAWIAASEQSDHVTEIRRSLHTLKGSGRMAGAMFMGEFAWVMEDLLNRVIDGSVMPDNALFSLVEKLPSVLKQLTVQITDGIPPTENISGLMAEAVELRSGAGEASTSSETDSNNGEESDTGSGCEPSAPQQEAVPDLDLPEAECTLLQIYTREAREILDTVRQYLGNDSENGRVTEPLYRGLHTLAGISESAEVGCIGRLASELDRYFSNLYHMQCSIPSVALAALRDSCDAIAHLIDKLPEVSNEKGAADALCDRIAALYQESRSTIDEDSAEHDVSLADAQDMPKSEAPVSVAGSDNDEGHQDDYFASVDQELFEVFEEEAVEILDASERVLHAWAADPADRDGLVEYQRHLHTLKGSARMMNITAIGDLSHLLETVLTRVVENTLDPSDSLFSALFIAQDQLGEMLEQVRQHRMPESCTDLESALEQLIDIQPAGPDADVDSTSNGADENTGDACGADDSVTIDACEDAGESADAGTEEPVSEVIESCPVIETIHELPAHNVPERMACEDESQNAAAIAPNVVPDTVQASAMREACPIPLRPSMEAWPARKQKQERKRGEQVKVQAELLDDLVNYSGEINIYRSRMEAQIGDYRFNLGELEQTINRLREQIRKLEMETEAQVLYRFAQDADRQNQDFDPLELDRYSVLQESSRSLMESISDLYSLLALMENTTRDSETLLLQQSRVSTDLHEGLMHTRMTPFAGLETRLKRIVRQSARQLDKKAELELQGADGEMDRAVIERIIAPLEHMLRNSVAHGIEPPGDRLGKGKEESGSIVIAFSREGPDIVLRVSDDGAGMNVNAIRAKAVEKGLLDPDIGISDGDVMQFVLQTGFTTASEVTQISGRGVGLDVVNSEVKQLGGALHIESVQGAGTVFTIRLPYTMAINQALLVKAGTDTYCVPLGNVEGVVRVLPEELLACYAADESVYQYAGNQYQLKHLGSLLNTDQLDASQMTARVPILLMHVADKRIALHVESLLGSREIVVKPLGMQLSSIDCISGATILGDGGVAMILDVFALLRSNIRAQLPVMRLVSPDEKRLVVMVVDDSITVRKVTTRLLERNGYKVLTAKDGVDATGQLQVCTPDIMLLDIEMPRMDGFELATHIRNDERLRHVPLVMITSRTGDKHRERAQQIGINYYLGKPYQENDLLGTIDQIVRGDPESSAVNSAGE